ncbi:MAG TPA: hypothetical protein VFS18_05570, partial [Actinomycetota bacterium]|nr:hypothetical protein [Actinomycetota bacterium]
MHLSGSSVAIVALALVGAVLPTNPAVAAPTCFGKKATIVGTNRNENKVVELRGTRGNDVIVGRGGSDLIYGRGGDDLICSGGGDDSIEAGSGDD